ncbi:MAG: hypothetical protein JO306_10655 [Gemmatimonadetes bacterium]|nr:hypothetical protein [Gemmatimonadota bacterium]
MSRATKYIRYGAFTWTVAVGLAFGAAQAFAAPQKPASTARACNDDSCDGACIARGFSGGVCNPGCTCF